MKGLARVFGICSTMTASRPEIVSSLELYHKYLAKLRMFILSFFFVIFRQFQPLKRMKNCISNVTGRVKVVKSVKVTHHSLKL